MVGLKDPSDDLKSVLHRYLQNSREALLWKLEGLDERQPRLPRTPTGTSLLGIVKHMVNVEIGYFSDRFGRAWPTPEERGRRRRSMSIRRRTGMPPTTRPRRA